MIKGLQNPDAAPLSSPDWWYNTPTCSSTAGSLSLPKRMTD